MKAAISLNFKCRNAIYPQSNVNRFTVPDILVPWITTYDEYKPTFYESPIINGKPWADPVISYLFIYLISNKNNEFSLYFSTKY